MKFLLPLSWIYCFVVALRNRLYDLGILKSRKLPGKVISVGNIAVGGTGKSPIVIDFARRLKANGASPAILTRGYRSGLRSGEWQVLVDGTVVAGVSRDGIMADEAMMQSLALSDIPVIIGRDRWRAFEGFRGSFRDQIITHWILDDGFQHRKIMRDIDVVLLDARSPSGDLIPSGMFREPITSLRRASMVILTKASEASQIDFVRQKIQSINVSCPVHVASFNALEPQLVVGTIERKPLHWGLVAGIAKPEDFVKSSVSIGIHPFRTRFYPDHSAIEFSGLQKLMQDCDALLTTEKDWARSKAVFQSLNAPVFILPLGVQWLGVQPEFL